MKIDLNSVKISGFQNIGEDQQYGIKPGLTAIIGINDDDGFSNGSGKSSAVRAITAGICGTEFLDVTNKEIRNRYLDIPPKIELNLTLNQKSNFVITRVIGGKLSALLDGVELVGKSEEIQKKIYEILGVTPEQLNNLTNKSQGAIGGFLMMKDKDKKDFLGSFFNLAAIENAQEKLQTKVSNVQMESSGINNQIQALSTQVSSLNDTISMAQLELNKLNSLEFKQEIEDLTKRNEIMTSEIASYKSIISNESEFEHWLHEIEEFRNAKELFNNAEKDISAQITSISLDISRTEAEVLALTEKTKETIVPLELKENLTLISQAIKNFHEAMKKKAKLESDIAAQQRELDRAVSSFQQVSSKTCPFCKQSMEDSLADLLKKQAESSVELTTSAINVLKTQLDALNVRGDEITTMEQMRNDLVGKISLAENPPEKAVMVSQINSLVSSKSAMLSRINSLKSELVSAESSVKMIKVNEKNKIQAKLSATQNEARSNEALIKAKQDMLSQAVTNLSRLLDQNSNLQSKLATLTNQFDLCNKKMNVLTKAAEVVSRKGFIGYIFDSILEELNYETNKNLKMIPNSYKFSLYFTSDSIAKTTGNVTKSISYKLFNRSDEISFDTLSGGEKLGVILAVDEALDTVLSRRLGVFVNWKVFDEQFMYIDEGSKEAIMDFLKNKSENKCFLIIDHAGEFNSAIENKIVVTKKNGIATIAG